MHFQKEDETVTFYKGPTGAHWGHPGNCHEQLLFFIEQGIYTLHNLTILLLDLEKKMFEICMVLALGALPLGPHGGHTYYLNNFESPTPKDDSCHFGLKSNYAFSKRR